MTETIPVQPLEGVLLRDKDRRLLCDKRQDQLSLYLVPGFICRRHLRGAVGKSQPWLLVDLFFFIEERG